MALQQMWLGLNRKDLAERAMVSNRDQKAQHKQRCESALKYHRDLNLLSSQYKNIEDNKDNKVQKVNEESRHTEEHRAKKKEHLEVRRHKLGIILAKENEIYLAELKTMSEQKQENESWDIIRLKEQVETLKKKRVEHEEMLKKSTTHRLVQDQKNFFKELEGKVENKNPEQQKKQLEKKATQKKFEGLQRKDLLEKDLQQIQDDIKNIKIERLGSLNKWQDSTKQAMSDIEDCKSKVESLDLEVIALNGYEDAVSGIVKQRVEIKDIQQARIDRILKYRPSKEKVQRMATEIKTRMETELKSLNFLEEFFKKAEYIIHLDLSDLGLAKDSISLDLTKESTQCTQINSMFEEEVSKLWKEKKTEWDKQEEEHRKLMDKVFESLLLQMKTRKENCKMEKEQVFQLKSQLVSDLSDYKEKCTAEAESLLAKEGCFYDRAQEIENELKKLQIFKPI